jgi:hypothetical protein
MTNPPRNLTLGGWWLFWGGFTIYGVLNFALLFGLGSLNLPMLPSAIILIGVIIGLMAITWLTGVAMLGYGLLVGYVFMTITSSGTCSFFRPMQNYEFLNGAVLFALALILGLVVLIIASVVQSIRNRS